MPRQTRAVIHRDAIRANFARACEQAEGAQVMAVVKADGYGHGLEQVGLALAGQAPCFAVACLEEAERLRAVGISQPIVLLEAVHEAADWEKCAPSGFEPVVHCEEQLAELEEQGAFDGLNLWLKINTGMNRLGFPPADAGRCVSRLSALPGVNLRGLMSHFACADSEDHPLSQLQLARLQSLQRQFPGLLISAANSAAHYRGPQMRFDWTRPGIMLYGGAPVLENTGQGLGLRPAMTLESRLIATRRIQAGETVGYGATWVADESIPMGIAAIGYGDGYPRHAPNGTPVAVAGKPATLIGRVSMDMIAVDLRHCPDARVGDRVELWGEQVSVDEVARLCGTISYELLSGVLPRVPRIYRG